MEWFAVDVGSLEESRVVDASETRTADGAEVIYMVQKRVDGGTPTTPGVLARASQSLWLSLAALLCAEPL